MINWFNQRHSIKIFIPVFVVILYFASIIFVEYAPILRESIVGYFISLPIIFIFAIIIGNLFYSVYLLLKKRKFPWFIFSGFIITFVTLIFYVIMPSIQDIKPYTLPTGSDRKAFNQKLWLENKQVNLYHTSRLEMLRDVANRLPGKNKGQVIEMLGKETFEKPDTNADYDLFYYVGGDGGASGAIVWLLIWFDNKDMFQKYHIGIYTP